MQGVAEGLGIAARTVEHLCSHGIKDCEHHLSTMVKRAPSHLHPRLQEPAGIKAVFELGKAEALSWAQEAGFLKTTRNKNGA